MTSDERQPSQPALAFAESLPAHAEVIEGLRAHINASEQWRWFELSCSLAAGRGDALSDIDAGAGYAAGLSPDDVEAAGRELVDAAGSVLDVLMHRMAGWPPECPRFAVEYASGVQLDLVVIPAARRQGLPTGALALVDKDGTLAKPWTPPVEGAPSADEAREWCLLGWWALSDVAKYVARGALFEAAQQLHEARNQALRLFATGRQVPFPSFGLVSLLDFEPYELPPDLEATYCVPSDAEDVRRAALAVADLLDDAAAAVAEVLGVDLDTPWAALARRRLAG